VASLGKKPGSFYLYLSIHLFDKGKPAEKQGRKAMGLPSHCCDQDRQAAENTNSVFVPARAPLSARKAMTPRINTTKTARSTSFLVALFISLFNPIHAQALVVTTSLPTFAEFSKSVQNGDAKVLRGVYVDKVFALPIIQQPANNAGFVSGNDGEITQFGMASQYGNVGLLAHNHLSGKSFSELAVGQEIRLVYGDGRTEVFVVSEVLHYQALQPTSPYSSFRNVDKDEPTLTAEQMFKRAYFGDRHVTFQTCIEANGNLSWGRLFVIATPKRPSALASIVSARFDD
jgi:hypothetical protein